MVKVMLTAQDIDIIKTIVNNAVNELRNDISNLELRMNNRISNLELRMNNRMEQLNNSFQTIQMKTNALSAIARIPLPTGGEEFDFGAAVPTPYSCDSNKLIMKKGIF